MCFGKKSNRFSKLFGNPPSTYLFTSKNDILNLGGYLCSGFLTNAVEVHIDTDIL